MPSLYCPHCGTEILESDPKFCPRCGKQIVTKLQTEEPKVSVTNWEPALKTDFGTSSGSYREYSLAWYLMPILFAFIGGVLAYLGVRDKDEDAAKILLWVGLLITLFWVVVLLGGILSV